MPDESTRSHGVMEGMGAYNRHAKLPAGGAAFALPQLEKAILNAELDISDRPVVIADYGSSQAKNSMVRHASAFPEDEMGTRLYRCPVGPVALFQATVA